MSLISRVTTWVTNQILTSSALNGEFNNITNLINNLDAATTTWTNVKVTTLSPQGDVTVLGNVIFSPTTKGVKGTTTNDSAATGNVGEYVTSTAGPISAGSNNVYFDVTTISLTAGDWDVTGNILFEDNGATGTACLGVTSLYSGNTGTDHVDGYNKSAAIFPGVTATQGTMGTIPRFRVSINATTTVYLKALFTFSVGTPRATGTIIARRMR